MPLEPLPIDSVLPDLIAAGREASALVLQAPTGAGKTTRVPSALLDSGLTPSGQILLLEPRRLAARAAARRIASERQCSLGAEVGYQVRFDQKCSNQTRILAITEGILLRRLQDDPFLEHVSAILFDEFHERSLSSDLALAMVRRVQQTVRPDLRIIVMSATLDPGPIAAFLGDCPVIRSEGRLFPVEIRYSGQSSTRQLPERITAAVADLVPHSAGDLLVFLPRVREIHQTARQLGPLAEDLRLQVLPLYGDLSPAEQDAVFQPGARRKVILATNVAETSVTIPGVTTVIDSGLVQQLQFDAGAGLDRLVLTRISQASAAQRAGRAGRTQPGVCVRLWLEREQRGLPETTAPEVQRVDLASAALELLCWGESDLAAFPWFERPSPEALDQALALLQRLGALHQGQPTPLGRQMARFPTHPRIARMLLTGHTLGRPEAVTWAAALLSERDPFERAPTRGPAAAPSHWSRSDLFDRVQAVREFLSTKTTDTDLGRLQPGAAYAVRDAQRQLQRLLQEICGPAPRTQLSDEAAVARAVLAGFADRVAVRREPSSRKALMAGGKGVRLSDQSRVLEADLFVCLDLDAAGGEAVVRLASAVELDWLPADQLTTTFDAEFDPATERIRTFRRTRFNDLIVEQAATSPPPDFDISGALAEAARECLEQVLPDSKEFAQFLVRVHCLREWLPELELPELGPEALRELLPELARGCRSFAELRRAHWLSAVQQTLPYPQQQAIEREAPEKLAVPSGSRITVHYEAGRPPVLAVRIQELFGLAETPRIARGRVPVLLHLLGPNYRPQQITDDLRSFWQNTYPDVRKELRRRYPKHSWPEDPWNATPERKPGKRS